MDRTCQKIDKKYEKIMKIFKKSFCWMVQMMYLSIKTICNTEGFSSYLSTFIYVSIYPPICLYIFLIPSLSFSLPLSSLSLSLSLSHFLSLSL